MCGIVGIVGERDDTRIEGSIIHRMCQTIVHRGPDDEGCFVKNGVGLGMRRLSIIDLASGHQPVFNEDRTAWVVLNGEIYNFLELRRELETRGHRFRTSSDTEVIIHLYEDLGAECVQKLRGMFAFAVYDERDRRLLLARDRLGKKPLHYALSDGRLLFGSEIKAILAAAPELAAVDSDALLQYLYLGYIHDPATAFQRIRKLPPGHLLEFHQGEVRVRRYWDLPEYGTYSPRNEEECLEQLEALVSEAVRIRLISDVPLGALLSGGTDSSTVVALMARASSRPVKTFSIGFRQAEFNEAPYARQVAQKFATEHQELIVDPDIVDTIETLTASLEEPFGDSSMLPTYFVSKLARQNVTVALSGDGGDEGFAGYERYGLYLRDRSIRWIPKWVCDSYRNHLYQRIPQGVPGRNLLYSISLPWPERYLEGVTLAPMQRNFGLLSDDFLRTANAGGHFLDSFCQHLNDAPAADPLSRILYLDTKTYLPGDILTKVDRMSMATSLEVRCPLLDHVLLEWVTALAPHWKMNRHGQKYILAKLALRVGVPSEVVYRPKRGFALPLLHWMRHELKELAIGLLLEPRSLQRGYWNERGVRNLLNRFLNGQSDDYLEIWRFMMLELWHRNFLSQSSRVDPEPEPIPECVVAEKRLG